MNSREYFLNKIGEERARHLENPGSENDLRHSPNEWVAIAVHFMSQDVRRSGNIPERRSFEESLIKSAAVILAALESLDSMQALGHLTGESQPHMDGFIDALHKLERK